MIFTYLKWLNIVGGTALIAAGAATVEIRIATAGVLYLAFGIFVVPKLKRLVGGEGGDVG